jgi:UDP-glucuronate decarboxylase
MRCLVTGGAGFLGSHLCDRLLAQGHHVTAVDNFFTGSRKNIEHLEGRNDFAFIKHDIVQPLQLDADRIYNLACPASPVHYQSNPVKTVKTSVMGIINMLGIAKRTGARLLQASTSEVYGDPLEHPQREEYFGNVNPIGPRACYDEGKRVAETLMSDYHRQHRVDIRILRIFNTYGPRMAVGDGRVVSNFIVQGLRGEPLTVYGDGTQTRSFCYVDDLLDAMMGLMEYTCPDAHLPVNAGSTDERSMNEIVDEISRILGRHLSVQHLDRPGVDPERRRPDCTRARQILNWQPRVPLTEGLRRSIEYFRLA